MFDTGPLQRRVGLREEFQVRVARRATKFRCVERGGCLSQQKAATTITTVRTVLTNDTTYYVHTGFNETKRHCTVLQQAAAEDAGERPDPLRSFAESVATEGMDGVDDDNDEAAGDMVFQRQIRATAKVREILICIFYNRKCGTRAKRDPETGRAAQASHGESKDTLGGGEAFLPRHLGAAAYDYVLVLIR